MTKKKVTYTEENIAIWKEADEKSIRIFSEKIRTGDNAELYSLTLAYESLGLTHIALGNYPAALGHFGAASEVWASLLERYLRRESIGDGLVDRALTVAFTLANASGADTVVRRLANAFAEVSEELRSRDYPLYCGAMIERALSLGDVETASQLTDSFPESKNWTTAPIIDQDDRRFADDMRRFAELWKDRVRSERLQRLPDAVCDHYEIGWIKLAEKVWGKRPEIDLEPGRIPKEIFEVEPELIDPGI